MMKVKVEVGVNSMTFKLKLSSCSLRCPSLVHPLFSELVECHGVAP